MQSQKNLLVLDFSVQASSKDLDPLLLKIKPKLPAVNVIVLLPPQKTESQDEINHCIQQISLLLETKGDLSTSRDPLTVGCLLTASAYKGRPTCVITSRSNFAPPHPLVKIYNFLEAELMKFEKLPSPALSEEEPPKPQDSPRLRADEAPDQSQPNDREILYVSYRFRSHLKRLFHMLAKALIQNVPRNVSSLINLCSTLCQGYVVREEKKSKEKLNLDQLTFEFVLRLFLDKIFLNKFVLEGIEKKRFKCIKDFLELDEIQQSQQTRQFTESKKEELNAKISQGKEEGGYDKTADSDELVTNSATQKFQFQTSQQTSQGGQGDKARQTKTKKETSGKGETVENFIYAIGSKIIELFKKMGLSQIKKLPKLRNSIANVVKNEAVKLSNSFLSENVEPVTDGVLQIFKAQGYIKVGGPGGLEYKQEYFEQMRPLNRQTSTPTIPPPGIPQMQLGHSFYPHGHFARGDYMASRAGYSTGFARGGGPKHYPPQFAPQTSYNDKYNPGYQSYGGYYGQVRMSLQDLVVSKLTPTTTTLKSLYQIIDESFREYNPAINNEKQIKDEGFKVLAKLKQDGLFIFEENPKLNPSLKDWYKIKPETWNERIIIRLRPM